MISFEAFEKDYPLIPIKNSRISISYVNFRDDCEIIQAACHALLKKIPPQTDFLVILGDKANGLGTLLAVRAKLPWIILTSKETPEGVYKKVCYTSITSGEKMMMISPRQADEIRGKNIVVLDDVISSGETMKAALELVNESCVLTLMTVLTEEKERTEFQGLGLISLAHIPIVRGV